MHRRFRSGNAPGRTFRNRVTRSSGRLRLSGTRTERSDSVAGSLPIIPITFGPQVLNSFGSSSSPATRSTYAAVR